MFAFGKEIPTNAIRILEEETAKFDALERMIDTVMTTRMVSDRGAFRKALFDREAIRSTGFRGVAIPHVRIDEILEPTIGVGVSRRGIDFDALDGEPVNVIVLFAMPSGSDKEYLGLLAQVMMSLRTDGFCEQLVACDTSGDVAAVLNQP